jgi:hypothetical protein
MASGIQLGKVELTDYPVTYDNSYYISYKVQPEIKVLAIYNNTSSTNGLNYFKALFTEDNYAKLDEANDKSLQISKLGNYNTIILINPEELTSGFINELEQAASNGSSIIFFPSLKGNITNYNRLFSLFGSNTITGLDTMSQELSGVAFEHPVYSGIFKEIKNNVKLPVINGHYKFSSATRIPETKLLWFKNGGKALSSIAYDDGFLYTFAFPANNKNENFVKDIIFVPTLYSIVLNSIARQKISYAIGTDEYLLINQNEIPKSNPSIIIQGTNNSKEFIPETLVSDKNKLRIDVVNQISKAGFYLLKSDNKTISPFAFNYNRSESDLRYFTSGELESQIAQTGSNNIIIIKNSGSQFSEIFEELQNGKQLWKWFILFALLFVIAEALIIRLWK